MWIEYKCADASLMLTKSVTNSLFVMIEYTNDHSNGYIIDYKVFAVSIESKKCVKI